MTDSLYIFNLPAIVLRKVRQSEIIDLLRERVNKHYMPSSLSKVQHNSKPEYTTRADTQLPELPSRNFMDGQGSGYFCLQDRFGFSDGRPIFFHLLVSHFQIVVNLKTEQTFVRHLNTTHKDALEFVEWKDHPDQTIPLDRQELLWVLEMHA